MILHVFPDVIIMQESGTIEFIPIFCSGILLFVIKHNFLFLFEEIGEEIIVLQHIKCTFRKNSCLSYIYPFTKYSMDL